MLTFCTDNVGNDNNDNTEQEGDSNSGKEDDGKQNPHEEEEQNPYTDTLISIGNRVNIQAEIAPANKIINNEWVAVGINVPYAIQQDYKLLYKGKPSFRFELKENDNSLEGYNDGETKGRAELSYCYAVESDFAGKTAKTIQRAVNAKVIYHSGKGIIPQACTSEHQFSIYVPEGLGNDMQTIFAQWHGMPDRRLAKDPNGVIRMLTEYEFEELFQRTIFKDDTGYEKVMETDSKGNPKYDSNGNIRYKAGAENGWIIEQGGYPPLAFGFNSNAFYIKVNSDKKWLTDKTDRTNVNVARGKTGSVSRSTYKTSTLAYKDAYENFPKERWVDFNVKITWSQYGGQSETESGGSLDVKMTYINDSGNEVTDHIVNNMSVPIGRNDDDGYYFKFGIYRTASSTVPVCYNLTDYKQNIK
jgi:heparin lyase